MDDPVSQLIARVDAYLLRTGQTATEFGLQVANNTALVPRLRARNATVKTVDMVWEFLESRESPKATRSKRKSTNGH